MSFSAPDPKSRPTRRRSKSVPWHDLLGVAFSFSLGGFVAVIAVVWLYAVVFQSGNFRSRDLGIPIILSIVAWLLLDNALSKLRYKKQTLLQKQRVLGKVCTRCGYDLRGAPGEVCPERGEARAKPLDSLADNLLTMSAETDATPNLIVGDTETTGEKEVLD